jgi:hypothetical protein
MARRMREAPTAGGRAQASRRMIARGDRPGYRITPAQDGRWHVDALPWLPVSVASRREALDAARTAIAEWLDVLPDTFDVEADKSRATRASGLPERWQT